MRGGGGVREERAPPPTTIKGGEREGGEKESGVAAEAVQLASSASASASASASPVKSDRVSDGGREALSPVCEEVESEKEKKKATSADQTDISFSRTQRRKTRGSGVRSVGRPQLILHLVAEPPPPPGPGRGGERSASWGG